VQKLAVPDAPHPGQIHSLFSADAQTHPRIIMSAKTRETVILMLFMLYGLLFILWTIHFSISFRFFAVGFRSGR
jgi:hypothetical protein